jgi:hypothetical protein
MRAPYIIQVSSDVRFKWIAVALLMVLIITALNLVLLSLHPGLFLLIPPEPVNPVSAPVSARSLTSTPYQPLPPTSTALASRMTAIPATRTPIPGPTYDFFNIAFDPGSADIKLLITPPTNQVNHRKPIVVAIHPSRKCPYETGRACVKAFRTEEGGNVIFVSVHSGVDGEAEAFRRAIEGLGVDRAGFSLKKIRSNLAGMAGATVQIKQEGRLIEGLQLAAVGRVPSKLVQEYFRSPVEQALSIAASVNPELQDFTHSSGTLLVFETCGWTVPGEAWAPGATSFSSSVYVSVIQLAP